LGRPCRPGNEGFGAPFASSFEKISFRPDILIQSENIATIDVLEAASPEAEQQLLDLKDIDPGIMIATGDLFIL
jgi:hypothetical protein